MAKSSNQKSKLLYLMKILMEQTDEEHGITMQEIINALEAYGIRSERKSLYDDMESLRSFGVDVIKTQENRNCNYRVASRDFELAELKLLVDSVQAAKFITAKKSAELIKKIEGLASVHEAGKLQRQVYIHERIKTANEEIFYNVDKIHTAISENSKITFKYFRWTVEKKMELRRNGGSYEVSPWALTWDDENYYLIAYDASDGKIKHFRVDKMLKIEENREPREGKEYFKNFDIPEYMKKHFAMFDGEEAYVKLECANAFAGVIIDRFGKEVPMIPLDKERFTTTVKVAVSRQFLTWVMSLGEGVRIVGPETVVQQVQNEIERLILQYRP